MEDHRFPQLRKNAHGCPNGLGAALIGKLLLSGPKKRYLDHGDGMKMG
jgi:hypothetical protein